MGVPARSRPRSAPPPTVTEIAAGVYAYVQLDGGWCLNNTGFLVGGDAVTMIDATATERRARRLREAIRDVTPLAPRTLVNTHHHGDHTYGNFVFAPEVTIVGHELARSEMLTAGLQLPAIWPDVTWGDIRITPPSVTFTDRLTLYVDDLRAELIHVGPAHTTNDVVVWIPERRVLFAGDVVFSGGTPFVLMGSVAGSLDAIGRLRGLGAEVVVAGHGPVGGPELFDTTEAYLRWVQRLAREGRAAGLSPLDVAREVSGGAPSGDRPSGDRPSGDRPSGDRLSGAGPGGFGEFDDLLDPERLVGNLHRAYAEEAGEPRGVRLDEASIMIEMVVYNDGQIPTCLA